jgi:hypothetical protein
VKKVAILFKIIGEVPDDKDIEQLEDCLYNNVMFDIEEFNVEDVEFLVKELEE